MEFERWETTGDYEIAEICEKNSRPPRQFDQKPWSRHGLRA
jgi:hypothetical protein